MNRKQIVNYFLLNRKITLSALSDSISVDRSNIYLWKDGKTSPNARYINKMAETLGFKIEWHSIDNIEILENEMQQDQERISDLKKIIELQESSLKLLEEKVLLLETALSDLERKPIIVNTKFWTALDMDFNYFIDFEKKTVQLMFKNIERFDLLTEKLGHSKDQLKRIFGLNEYHEYSQHPIHKLRIEKDVQRMLKNANEMMSNMLTTKSMMAKYEVEVPILYRHKNGQKVYTLNTYIINTETKSGTCKILFVDSQ